MNQTLIKNINIWTMDERDSRFFGWILLENGRIASMGEGETPDCESVIDGEGGVLTPGLIDIHSHIGLYEDGLGFEGADGNEDTDPATPHLRALDGVNPFDRSFREALEAGVTAAAVSPGSANPIGGQIALLKTAGRRVDDMILKAPLAIKFALGENPKSVYHDKDETPVTRMATAGIIREELYKAKEYFSRKARAEDDPEQDEPDFDIKMDAAMVQDTEKMMGGLQQLTEKVTSGAVKLNDETQMKKISEKFGEMTDYTFSSSTGKGDYDLYIWTNGADGRPASGGKTERYPYLMKVQNVHVSEKNLPRLLDKEFIQKGEFSGNSEALDILRSLLKVANVEKAGVSVGKVYGKDVLLVTVPAGTTIPQTAAPKTLTT